MRKMFAGLIAVAFVVALSAPAFAKTETVKGKIVDVSCYNMDKANNAGKDHKMPKGDTADCATGCAKAGRPMAILTDDGKVYELTGGLAAEKNAKIVPHVAHTEPRELAHERRRVELGHDDRRELLGRTAGGPGGVGDALPDRGKPFRRPGTSRRSAGPTWNGSGRASPVRAA